MLVNTLTASLVQQDCRLGSLWNRSLAATLDSVLGLPFSFGTTALTAYVFGIKAQNGYLELWNEPFVVAMALNLVFWLAYYIAAEGLYGSTLGKEICGLQVRDSGGRRCSLGQVLFRNLLRPIDAIGLYLIGFLLALSTPSRQRIGDRYANTIVTKNSSPRRLMALMLWLSANLVLTCAAYLIWQQLL